MRKTEGGPHCCRKWFWQCGKSLQIINRLGSDFIIGLSDEKGHHKVGLWHEASLASCPSGFAVTDNW